MKLPLSSITFILTIGKFIKALGGVTIRNLEVLDYRLNPHSTDFVFY